MEVIYHPLAQRDVLEILRSSDCDDRVGAGPQCQGAETIEMVRRLASSKAIERKLLYKNAKRVFRI